MTNAGVHIEIEGVELSVTDSLMDAIADLVYDRFGQYDVFIYGHFDGTCEKSPHCLGRKEN